jgi:putative transposase
MGKQTAQPIQPRQGRLNDTMAHTFSYLVSHIIFSTRSRAALLQGVDRAELMRVAGGICQRADATLIAGNGTDNHVHLLVRSRPSCAISDLVRNLKSNTTNWIHEHHATHSLFSWQKGYSVFSVSRSSVGAVEVYIQGQAEHHKKLTFEEELLSILAKHEIEYDERFVLDR